MDKAGTGEGVTGQVAHFASALKLGDIPDSVRENAKLLFLDALAAGICGWSSPEADRVFKGAVNTMGSGSTTVLGGKTLSMGGAALVNGYLITARSICDLHQPTLCHITPVVIPPAIALAEREGIDGETFVTALTAALEANVRIAAGLDYPKFRSKGWHTPGVAGPIAGALGASRLLGFDPRQSEQAMGIAGSQSAGSFASFGTPTIKFHQARAAWSALIAAMLVSEGFIGPESILTAPDGGIYNIFGDGGLPELVIDGLGDRWRISEITLRMWPAAASLQSILTIIDHNDMIDAKEIESVTVRLPPANFEMNAEIGWRSTFEATLSARYVTARALIRGGLWLEDFEAAGLNDPEVDGFARTKVQVVSDDSVTDSGAGLTITPTHGTPRSFEQLAPLGSPEHPALRDDVSAKFRRCAAGRLDEADVEEIISRVGTLENEVSIRPLMQLLRGKGAG